MLDGFGFGLLERVRVRDEVLDVSCVISWDRGMMAMAMVRSHVEKDFLEECFRGGGIMDALMGWKGVP